MNNPRGGRMSRTQTAFARGGRHPFSRLSFFPYKHSHRFLEDVLLRSKDSKGKMHDEATEPGVGACTYYLYAEFYVFNVSMKHRQCEREPGPDMLSVNATSAVVPFLYVV